MYRTYRVIHLIKRTFNQRFCKAKSHTYGIGEKLRAPCACWWEIEGNKNRNRHTQSVFLAFVFSLLSVCGDIFHALGFFYSFDLQGEVLSLVTWLAETSAIDLQGPACINYEAGNFFFRDGLEPKYVSSSSLVLKQRGGGDLRTTARPEESRQGLRRRWVNGDATRTLQVSIWFVEIWVQLELNFKDSYLAKYGLLKEDIWLLKMWKFELVQLVQHSSCHFDPTLVRVVRIRSSWHIWWPRFFPLESVWQPFTWWNLLPDIVPVHPLLIHFPCPPPPWKCRCFV